MKIAKIYLHTGCQYSESWDEAFQSILSEFKIPYQLCDLQTINPTGGIFIGRINESCRYLKNCYEKKFDKMWPEPLAMQLYDDKFAQVEFLKPYPTPHQMVVHSEADVPDDFPIVVKKAEGSASKNVYLAHSKSQIKSYPSLLQEFCNNNEGDYRITVIGDYVMGVFRRNRPNDFRASGSNDCIMLNELPLEPAFLSWKICKDHKFVTMAFDFLKMDGKWVIIEMSYTYPIYSISRYCAFCLNMNTGERIEGSPDPARLILSEILQIKHL